MYQAFVPSAQKVLRFFTFFVLKNVVIIEPDSVAFTILIQVNKKFANAKNIFRYSIPHIYIDASPDKGRGVFAARPIKKGEQIELCPVLVLSNDDTQFIIQSKLYNYYFLWGDDSSKSGLALGFGSLYNHSYRANARYQVDYAGETIEIFAYRDIEAGEEIFINYNGEPNDPELVWFDKNKPTPT